MCQFSNYAETAGRPCEKFSTAKIRISLSAKQIYLHFAEQISKTKSKVTNKPNAKANFLLHFAERNISKTKSKITNKPNASKFLLRFARGGVSKRSQRYENSLSFVRKATTARFARKIHPVPDLQSARSRQNAARPPFLGNSSPILFPKILPANRLGENHTVLCGIEPQQLQQRLFLEAAP